jgi:LysR family cys regulon transcriptional activator
MNLQQLRFVQQAARHNLNLTATAKALHTSQPGVSKAIIELEEELGILIFMRHGKKLKHITEAGQQILASIEIILQETTNLRRIGQEYSKQDTGILSIATTHAQARYFLPPHIAEFRQRFPQVSISLHQGSPAQVAKMLLEETADIGIATEAIGQYKDLISLPCYSWQHVIVFPKNHPLAKIQKLDLKTLAQQPIVTYHPTFTGRSRIDEGFAKQGLTPTIVLEAIDADVIKTYVRLGLGIGIVGEMAVQNHLDHLNHADHLNDLNDLILRPAGHLFGENMTRVAFKRGAYLRLFVLAFAELLSPRLERSVVQKALLDDAA